MNELIALEGWDKWHDWHAAVMAPLTQWFVDGVAPGQRVLDVACGTGLPALAIAERVGASGRLVATDVAAGMVAATRRRGAGLEQLTVREASIDALPFDDGSFDVVTCKDGLMYAADLALGARELKRVLRPGGRVLVSAWDEAPHAAFFRTLFQSMAPFVSTPPPPDAPGPLRLSTPGRVESLLRDAGFAAVQLERREVVFAFDSLDHHWNAVRELAGPVGAFAAKASAEDVARLRSTLAAALAPFTNPGGAVWLPTNALCVSGTR
ncbi:MAG: class I SAM-dependent methyltransferase [Archangium sp.]